MMTTILAHFDGKQSLVLDEPVDLPVGTQLRVYIETLPTKPDGHAEYLLAPVIMGLDPVLAQAIASSPEFAAENM